MVYSYTNEHVHQNRIYVYVFIMFYYTTLLFTTNLLFGHVNYTLERAILLCTVVLNKPGRSQLFAVNVSQQPIIFPFSTNFFYYQF